MGLPGVLLLATVGTLFICRPAQAIELVSLRGADVCSVDVINGDDVAHVNGTLTSPNYPESYPLDVSCQTRFRVPDGKRLTLRFTDVNIEKSEACKYDYISIRDHNTSAPLGLGRYCGVEIPPDMVVTRDVVVQFVSDFFGSVVGFRMEWSYSDAVCLPNEHECWNGDCFSSSLRCDGNNDCSDGSDEVSCVHDAVSVEECGKNQVAPQFQWNYRVAGGEKAVPDAWPFVVRVYNKLSQYRCTASIVNTNWLLTTRECAADNQQGYVELNDGGRHSIDVVFPDEQRDAALMRLANPLQFNSSTRALCMPSSVALGSDRPRPGDTCVVVGFGKYSYTIEEGATYAQAPPSQVRVPINNEALCEGANPDFDGDQHICAGSYKNGTTRGHICEGDAGAPLICLREGSWTQYGLASRNDQCDRDSKSPGLYVDVAGIAGWINQTVERFPRMDDGQTTDICSHSSVSGLSGYIISPNYPGSHDSDLNCTITIPAVAGKRVEVFFEDFLIEGGSECEYDNFTTYVGEEKLSGASFCSYTHEPLNFTTEKQVVFNFVSDSATEYRGFKIFWEFVEDCARDQFRCWDGSCISASQKCDGISDCPNQSDEIECPHAPESVGECGKNSYEVGFTWDHRIVGGNQAREHSYPWAVALMRMSDGMQSCGASILSEYWLLTAAHCVEDDKPHEQYYGVIGSNDSGNLTRRITFDRAILHERYNSPAQGFDIALLRTSEPMRFDDTVAPLCLAQSSQGITTGEVCVVVGWGHLYSYAARSPDKLRQVRLPVVDEEACRDHFAQNDSLQFDFPENVLCAGDLKGGRDSCQGDSGGPLQCYRGGSWYQYGIVSTGAGCAQPDNLGLYTDVRQYSDWIERNQRNNRVDKDGEAIDICDDKEVQGDNGFIQSPNYPGLYPRNLDCMKNISARPGKLLHIEFLMFDIEGQSCRFDFVQILLDGEQMSAVPFCGNMSSRPAHVPFDFSTDQNFTVHFSSDFRDNFPGFNMKWSFVDDCARDQFRCWDGSCISAAQRCDGFSDCPNQSDEIECSHPPMDYGECGKNQEPAVFTWDPKIIGGSRAGNNSYPWVISLFSRDSESLECTATVVSDRWVLTAASCVSENANDLYGIYGSSFPSDPQRNRIEFDRFVKHPEYQNLGSDTAQRNVVLLHTAAPIRFNEQISPVCLASPSDRFRTDNETCVVAAWGSVELVKIDHPQVLLQTRSEIFDTGRCGELYGFQLPNDTVCAGQPFGGRHLCDGDDGGPLLCYRDGSWLQFAVAGSNSRCGDNGAPALFSDLRPVNEWIERIINPERFTTGPATTMGMTTDPATTEPATTVQPTTESATAEQSTTEAATAEQSTTEAATAEQSTTGTATSEQSTTEQFTTEGATTESIHTAMTSTESSTQQQTTHAHATTAPAPKLDEEEVREVLEVIGSNLNPSARLFTFWAHAALKNRGTGPLFRGDAHQSSTFGHGGVEHMDTSVLHKIVKARKAGKRRLQRLMHDRF